MNEKEAKHLATFLNWLFTTEAWVAVSTDPVEQYSWVALKYRNRQLVAIHNPYSFWLFLRTRLRDDYDMVHMKPKQAKHIAKTLNWLLHARHWKQEKLRGGRGDMDVVAWRDDTYSNALIMKIETQSDIIPLLSRYFESEKPLQYEDKDE